MHEWSRGAAAIVGGGTYGVGDAPGFTATELAAKASLNALADANLALSDVDGIFLCMPDDMLSGLSFSEYLGLTPRHTDNNRLGGSSFMSHAVTAALYLEAGLIDIALIAYGSVSRSSRKLLVAPGSSDFESPFNVTLAASYALATRRHMHEYGTTAEQLASVAVSMRKWARHHPDAMLRDELTIAECLASRPVASPLKVRDCCLVTDGGGAIVMMRADRAKDHCTRPAYLLGGAAATTHRYISAMADLTRTAAADCGPRAFALAGLTPADVDIAQLYDAFTINPILFLEDLGFCRKGEAATFFAEGNAAPGGALPVNTNGGGLSCVHPGMYGIFAIEEAFRQISRTARGLQVENADVAVVHGNGGVLSSQATLILGSAATL
ncbi:MAG: thiolase [Sphingomonas sp.]|uniref:acetyl-CoA acetyltransferase n=1 Tax=Sphingomonas sp. TaxID=28214 RepID=UPI0025D4C4F7|nr:acetyl-CoA acetyltransferase [Sphingomonas sp.]MBX3563510.1 thiolase [Sphingomonas sp.]